MARIFMDGGESGQIDLWDTVSGVSLVTASTYEMTGSYCFYIEDSDYMIKNITADTEMYFAFLVRLPGTVSGSSIITLYSDSTIVGGIRHSNNGTDGPFQAIVSTSGGVVATTPLVYKRDTVYLLELRYQMADSGVIQLKVNGRLVIDYSGDTKPGALTSFNKIRFGYNGVNSKIYLDNIVFDDANWIKNTKVQGAIRPTGAGATTQWDPSTGNNWDCVNEETISYDDYVKTNVVDEIDTYVCGNLSVSPYSIKSVILYAFVGKVGLSTPANCRLVVRPASTDRLSSEDIPINTTIGPKQAIWELNPEDSAAWEEADVNGMEIGIKSLT